MKNSKIPLISGDEHDLFSRYWRHCVSWKCGERKAIKRRYNKRLRRKMKQFEVT